MRPVTVSVTGVGTAMVPIDWREGPFNIGIGCVVNGTATYNVEHAYNSPFDGSTTNWFTDADITGKTANAEVSYPGTGTNQIGPFQQLRLNVTAGTGTVTMTVVSSGGT